MECSLSNHAHWRGLLILATLVAPGAAFAADNGFYLGLASSDVSSDYAVAPFDASRAEDDRGLKAIVGFRPLDKFAIEANYVDFGETHVPISFPPSTLSIDSDPAADVFVDRQPAGRTPLRIAKLKAGSHLIWMERDGYLRYTRVLQVPAVRVSRVVATLEQTASQ